MAKREKTKLITVTQLNSENNFRNEIDKKEKWHEYDHQILSILKPSR